MEGANRRRVDGKGERMGQPSAFLWSTSTDGEVNSGAKVEPRGLGGRRDRAI